jgi:hypothetical protein
MERVVQGKGQWYHCVDFGDCVAEPTLHELPTLDGIVTMCPRTLSRIMVGICKAACGCYQGMAEGMLKTQFVKCSYESQKPCREQHGMTDKV